MQEHVIIVAGGSGSRMKSDIPKQFIAVNGLPILMHTILAFRNYSTHLNIIVVLPETSVETWANLCRQYSFTQEISIVFGGKTRFDSVKNGLNSITEESGVVAVHDAVRPIISKDLIKKGFEASEEHGAAVVSVLLKDSIRFIDQDQKNRSVDRAQFRLIQTPQTFRLDWMRDAFSVEYQEHFTDCASVLESKGYPIHLIEGAYENIKITTPEDLRWAEIYLSQHNKVDF